MSRQESRTGYARGARRLALVALLGGTTLGFGDSRPVRTDAVCGGAPVWERRDVKINSGRVDFGDDPHWFGAPQTEGWICWDGGATVEGKLYWDAFEAGCAHLSLLYFDSNSPSQRLRLATYRSCSPGGNRSVRLAEPHVGSGTTPANRVGSISFQLSTSATANGPKNYRDERNYSF
jgi:hypothetical protein